MIFWGVITGLCVLVLIVLLGPGFLGRVLQQKSQRRSVLMIGIIVLVPLLSVLLYAHWGSYTKVQQAKQVQTHLAEVKASISQSGSRQSLISEFEQHLREKPQDAKGWYLLGKLTLRDGRVKEAIKALRQSNALKPNDPETLLALAEALMVANNNVLTSESQVLLEKVLEVSSNAIEALNLLAIHAYNKGQYNQAVSYFERLLPYYSPESEEGQRLLKIIARAQKLSQ